MAGQSYKPQLREIAPIVYWASWMFAAFNILSLSPAFYLGGGREFFLSRWIFGPPFWGTVFLSIGLAMAVALTTNNWKLLRGLHILGVFTKSLWGWALLVTLSVNLQNIGVVGLWFLAFGLQGLLAIFFIPGKNKGHG